MPSRRVRGRFEPNPAAFRELASSPQMQGAMWQAAVRGAAALEGLAPTYVGPTWKPGVSRSGEYKRQIFAETHLNPSGWRGYFGSDAPWTLQVEFGTGGGGSAGGRARNRRGQFVTRRRRPQYGWSPKFRPMGRALDSMRVS